MFIHRLIWDRITLNNSIICFPASPIPENQQQHCQRKKQDYNICPNNGNAVDHYTIYQPQCCARRGY